MGGGGGVRGKEDDKTYVCRGWGMIMVKMEGGGGGRKRERRGMGREKGRKEIIHQLLLSMFAFPKIPPLVVNVEDQQPTTSDWQLDVVSDCPSVVAFECPLLSAL